MAITDSFRELAGVLEALEAAGIEVADVSSRDGELLADGSVSIRISVATALFDGVDTDDGVEITPERVDLGEDGSITADLSVSVPVDDGGTDGRSGTTADEPREVSTGESGETPTDGTDDDPGEAPTDDPREGIPPHRDPEKLRSVYREHGTFAEMTEALGADVTPQTVRRNMIEHGIHEPASGGADGEDTDEGAHTDRADETPDGATDPDDGSGVDEAEEPGAGEHGTESEVGASTPLADGVDLPDGVSLEDIKEAVAGSRTLHEVQGRLGVDRERARRLLRELGLLDLVARRLSEGSDEVSMEEIDRRIRRAAPTSA